MILFYLQELTEYSKVIYRDYFVSKSQNKSVVQINGRKFKLFSKEEYMKFKNSVEKMGFKVRIGMKNKVWCNSRYIQIFKKNVKVKLDNNCIYQFYPNPKGFSIIIW